MAQQNQSTYRGLGVSWPLTSANLWAAQASYTQQAPEAGQAVPRQRCVLQIDPSGSGQESALVVRTARAGHPGPGGAAFAWRYETDPTTAYRGRDIQQASGWQSIDTVGVDDVAQCLHPDVVSLPSGQIIATYHAGFSSGAAYRVRVAVFDPDAWTWTKTDLYTTSTSPTDGFHPAIAVNERGEVFVAHWVYDGSALEAQIRVHRSTDNGTSWETVSAHALSDPVDISSSYGVGNPGYTCGRIRMAFNGGQCLLVAQLGVNNSSLTVEDTLAQYASTSDAGRFDLVEMAPTMTDRFVAHSIVVYNGTFYVGHIATIGFFWTPLPSAYASLASRWAGLWSAGATVLPQESSGGGGVLGLSLPISTALCTDSDASAWVDESGTLYALFRAMDSGSPAKPNALFLMMSFDGGETWKYAGDGDRTEEYAEAATVYYSGDGATYLRRYAGCSHRGRQVVITQNSTDVATTDHSIGALFIGGYSTVTLPSRLDHPYDYQRSGWSQSWLPIELPDNTTWGAAGAGTASLTNVALVRTERALQIATSATTKHYSITPTSTLAQGIVVRARLACTVGGAVGSDDVALVIRTADGSADYEAHLRFSTTQIRAIDDNSGSTLATVTTFVSLGVDVLVALTATGKFSAWYRANSMDSDRPWTAICENQSLNNAGATGASNLIRWGNVASSTSTSAWFELHHMIGAQGQGEMGNGFANPADLLGRDYPQRGRIAYLADGVSVSTRDGSAMEGDLYDIAPRYRYPIERLLWAHNRSPRTQYRSLAEAAVTDAVDAQFFPFVLNPDASALGNTEQGMGNSLVYFAGLNTNFRQFTIERRDISGPSWQVEATVDTGTSFSGLRRGSEVRAAAGAGSTSGYYAQNELIGWFVDLGSNVIKRVRGNTPGTLTGSGSNSQKCSIFLDNVDNSEPSSGTFVLFPADWCLLLSVRAETGSAWGLRTTAQRTYTGDIRLGHFSFGQVFVPGWQYDRGRIITYEPNTSASEQADGTLLALEMGPGGRTLRVAWSSSGWDSSGVWGDGTDPDYRSLTDSVGSAPIATVPDVGFSLEGVVRDVGRGVRPLIYLPRIPGVFDGTWSLLTRREAFGLYTVDGPVQLEAVLGDEMETGATAAEVLRVATLALRQVR